MGKITNKRWLKVCTLFFVVLLPLFLGSCGGSQNEPIWNITGTTNVFQTTVLPVGAPEVGLGLFTFTQSGNTLTGTTPQGQGITAGTVSGSNIAFAFLGADLVTTYTYSGIISGGGIMSGTWTATNGQSGTWRSTKSS